MKFNIAALAAALTLCAATLSPAQAGVFDNLGSPNTAYLQSCRSGASVTGRPIYIGTYVINGNTFERAFESPCPNTIQVN